MQEFGKIRVFALLYGNYHVLHKRLLASLHVRMPTSVPIHLWLNTVCNETKELVEETRAARPNVFVFVSNENKPKYHCMREMFGGFKEKDEDGSYRYPETWAMWFDDDSYIEDYYFYSSICGFMAKNDAWYVGQPWFVHLKEGQAEWIKSQPWYKGVPFEVIKGKPGINFAQGSFWVLRSDLIRSLDWPLNLAHNGGDVMLGEAVRQQGISFLKFWKGVKLNNAPRRGYSEPPAGCKDKDVRI